MSLSSSIHGKSKATTSRPYVIALSAWGDGQPLDSVQALKASFIRPAFKSVLTAPHTARVAPWASMRYPRSEVQCVHVAEILTVRGNL